MQNLNYTIRLDGKIVAKAEYIGIAAKIVNGLSAERSVKVIDNVYNRVAFNNHGRHWDFNEIYDALIAKREQFYSDSIGGE